MILHVKKTTKIHQNSRNSPTFILIFRFARLGKRQPKSNQPLTRRKRNVLTSSYRDLEVDPSCLDLDKRDSIVGISQWGKRNRQVD